MKPISNVNFGNEPGKIAVKFHNGNTTVDGYVVKQTGTTRFLVANANAASTTFTCTLATTTTTANALVAGTCTILATPYGATANTVEHVARISSRMVTTTEGNTYSWFLTTAPIPGSVKLGTI